MVKQSLDWVYLAFISTLNHQTTPLNAAELRACWGRETKFSLLPSCLNFAGWSWQAAVTHRLFYTSWATRGQEEAGSQKRGGLVLCGPVKPRAINSLFLLLPAPPAVCPHQLQRLRLGHGAGEGLAGTSKGGVLYLEDPLLQTSTFSICKLVLGALLPGEGSYTWEKRMLGRATDSFPRLLSCARAKTALSLLATERKKQFSKLCCTLCREAAVCLSCRAPAPHRCMGSTSHPGACRRLVRARTGVTSAI